MRLRISALGTHAVVAVATVLVTTIIEHSLTKGEISWSALGVGVVMVLSAFVAVVVYSAVIEPSLTDNIEKVTTHLESVSQTISGDLRGVSRNLQKITLGIQDNLITLDETIRMERAATDIYVVTRDFYWDLDHDFGSVTVDNIITRNISYCYLCPNTGRSHDAVSDLTKRLPIDHSFHVSYLPPEMMAATLFEFVLYDRKDEGRAQGVIVDILWRRYFDPSKAIELVMDRANVLPRFNALVDDWLDKYPPVKFSGTRAT